ncbi:hypothetical protein GQX74_006200 [Glossina fuscipes]|nr:hypothetical protein GQX74_006200 [Glossina fuscipes]
MLKQITKSIVDSGGTCRNPWNGSQDAIKEPIIKPSMSVARFSFFRAIRRFSFSGSRDFCTLGMAGSSSAFITSAVGLLGSLTAFAANLASFWRRLLALRPKIGWQKRNFNGLTTAHRLTTPESELEGSNSLTKSVSMPTDNARQRATIGETFNSLGELLLVVVVILVTIKLLVAVELALVIVTLPLLLLSVAADLLFMLLLACIKVGTGTLKPP